jgi:hypothetical protein
MQRSGRKGVDPSAPRSGQGAQVNKLVPNRAKTQEETAMRAVGIPLKIASKNGRQRINILLF